MTDKYPGYDVLDKRWTLSWNDETRRVIDERLAAPREPRFFTRAEWRTLGAVCDRIMPQPKDRPPVPLPSYVDQKLSERMLDGYRYAQMPPQDEAWRTGLKALTHDSQLAYGAPFEALSPQQQDEMLRRMQKGELSGPEWAGMPCKMFFEHRVLPDIVHAYYAHPTAWSEIGFGGPASPRGYVRMGLNRRDGWEAVEAKGGDEAEVRGKNKRVG